MDRKNRDACGVRAEAAEGWRKGEREYYLSQLASNLYTSHTNTHQGDQEPTKLKFFSKPEKGEKKGATGVMDRGRGGEGVILNRYAVECFHFINYAEKIKKRGSFPYPPT